VGVRVGRDAVDVGERDSVRRDQAELHGQHRLVDDHER
jgi:hypothetical protein